MVLAVWVTLAVVWVLFLVPILSLRRRVDRYAWPAWGVTLRGEVAEHFAYLSELLEGNTELVRELLSVAERHRERGAFELARKRLREMLAMVAGLVTQAQARLDEWLVVCHTALALYPLPPLQAGVFRLWVLAALARVHQAFHAVTVTSGERFRLRLRVLERGFGFLAHVARSSGRRLDRRPVPQVAESDWRRASDIAEDFETLSHETLGSARGLLSAENATWHQGSPHAGGTALWTRSSDHP